jgi:hypothetical protein
LCHSSRSSHVSLPTLEESFTRLGSLDSREEIFLVDLIGMLHHFFLALLQLLEQLCRLRVLQIHLTLDSFQDKFLIDFR